MIPSKCRQGSSLGSVHLDGVVRTRRLGACSKDTRVHGCPRSIQPVVTARGELHHVIHARDGTIHVPVDEPVCPAVVVEQWTGRPGAYSKFESVAQHGSTGWDGDDNRIISNDPLGSFHAT